MSVVLVSNNSEVLRHLATTAFRRLDIEVVVVSTGTEALEAAQAEPPTLALLDAEMPEHSGYDVSSTLKSQYPSCQVVLIVERRLNAEVMSKVSRSGCDEVLVTPMTSDDLYDAVAVRLSLPSRGSERFAIDLAAVTDDGDRSVDGRVTNLSVDGARLVSPEPIGEGATLRLTITPDDVDSAPVVVRANVVWSQTDGDTTVAGAAFVDVDDTTLRKLRRLTQWDIIDDGERTRVVLKGDMTEATNFLDLLPELIGRVDFDLSNVGYINSLGVSAWLDFLSQAKIQGYEFHACSVAFVLQASLAPNILGHGAIASFFAPYMCRACGYQEERLLHTTAVLASADLDAPTFGCPACADKLVLDELPERYFAFLDRGS